MTAAPPPPLTFGRPNTWSGRLAIWVQLARPLILVISVLGALTGALNVTLARIPVNAGASLSLAALAASLVAAGCLAAGLMVHNDTTDHASDRVNRPHKPIPAGRVDLAAARRAAFGLVALALGLALATGPAAGAPVNWPAGLLTLAVIAIGLAYNERGKYAGLWGHAAVAFGVGAIPWWGALAVRPEEPWLMLPLAAAVFVMEIGREIMVCTGDLRGDLAAGFCTAPVRYGRRPAMLLALAFYLASLPVFLLPYCGCLGVPPVFSHVYLAGALLFFAILATTWMRTYRAVLAGDETAIWRSFERNIRLHTRLGVLLFQLALLVEVFV